MVTDTTPPYESLNSLTMQANFNLIAGLPKSVELQKAEPQLHFVAFIFRQAQFLLFSFVLLYVLCFCNSVCILHTKKCRINIPLSRALFFSYIFCVCGART